MPHLSGLVEKPAEQNGTLASPAAENVKAFSAYARVLLRRPTVPISGKTSGCPPRFTMLYITCWLILAWPGISLNGSALHAFRIDSIHEGSKAANGTRFAQRLGVNRQDDISESLERLKLKYEALRDIAVRAVNGDDIGEISRKAVENAVEIIGVQAGSLTLYDSVGQGTKTVSSGSDEYLPIMQELEQKLISMLRHDFSVESLFVTLDRNGPHSLFSYPLVIGGKSIGAISGVKRGRRNLSVEQEFIEAISSQLALAFFTLKPVKDIADGDIKKAKTEAIIQTAVTLNHEINNPLTAVLGNVQLLLINRDRLDAKTVKMLESIESAALRIKEVTGRLMKAVEPAVTEYAAGVKMVDIEKTSDPEKRD